MNPAADGHLFFFYDIVGVSVWNLYGFRFTCVAAKGSQSTDLWVLP